LESAAFAALPAAPLVLPAAFKAKVVGVDEDQDEKDPAPDVGIADEAEKEAVVDDIANSGFTDDDDDDDDEAAGGREGVDIAEAFWRRPSISDLLFAAGVEVVRVVMVLRRVAGDPGGLASR
jgi:hypothetical protein